MPTFKLAESPFIKRIVGTFGDVNAPDYDGGFVFVHSQGDTLDWEYVEVPGEDWDCPKCWGNPLLECGNEGCRYEDECPGAGEATCVFCKGTGKNPKLRWLVYSGLVEEPDWADYKAVASYTGQDEADYAAVWVDPPRPLTNGEIMARMRVIEDVASYHSWYEFDQEPLSLTYAEITARYEGFDAHRLSQKEEERLQEKYG
jgi:hypothetical protein